jgi:hypothetical protein
MRARNLVSRLFALLVLLTVTLYIYGPSLNNPPKADQWGFLLENYNSSSCLTEIRHSYSYNRTTSVAPGDRILFRPVLFFFLSVVDCFGRTSLPFVQSFGLILHFFITFLTFLILEKVLRSIGTYDDRKGPLPFIFALTFSLVIASCPSFIEQVIWAHIHAYLLSTLLVLVAFFICVRERKRLSSVELSTLFLLCLVSCFCYEGNLFLPFWIVFLIFLDGWQTHSRIMVSIRRAIPFLMIFPGYVFVSLWDAKVHSVSPGDLVRESPIHASIGTTLFNYLRFARYTMWDPLFSSMMNHTDYQGRLLVHELHHNFLYLFATVVLLATLVGIVIWAVDRCYRSMSNARVNDWGPRLAMLYAPASLWLFSYGTLNVVGRLNPHPGPAVLDTNSYYTYIPTLITLVILAPAFYVVMILGRRVAKPKIVSTSWFVAIFLVSLNIYSLFQMRKARQWNQYVASQERTVSKLLSAISDQIVKDPFARFRLGEREKFTEFHGVPEPQIFLGASRFDACSANYTILSSPPYIAERKHNELECSPILVRPGPTWNFYWYKNEYVGVLRWEGVFDPKRLDYTLPIQALTWADSLSKETLMQERLNQMIADRTYLLPDSARKP